MVLSQHTIAGTVLTMPVRVRHADVHSAMFSVPADATQAMIDYSGLRVFQHQPGRAVVNLMLARYIDGDLGRYLEFGTAVMVNPPGSEASGWRALGSAGAFIHHLPVDQAFTLEAGRTIWGFPKIMADFTVRDGRRLGFDVAADGQHIATMEFARGLPVPGLFTSRPRTLQAFSYLDGVARQIPWEMKVSKVRWALGGAELRLGTHPYARELAALGLPKRPMLSSTVGRVEMTFGDAEVFSA
ncbi:acetoacetate decarboxylase [Mycolicibacter engbaekii]|uniref:Acetoacetate decarboxylase n=1 Tax=Mycolicibacter engbaekii TaxID=188915 RepID=A0A1X1U5B6_9MYCO|nr:acetoacetate decarboxylase family protein [Mycolicibacter engbaekii]ORV51839.1 acetoacetate decarboxylase [Mycolicibacter engbaekii]